jgi:hypothetical protein
MNLTIKSIAFCSVSDQALQPDALGISSVSRSKRNKAGSPRVERGNPGYN